VVDRDAVSAAEVFEAAIAADERVGAPLAGRVGELDAAFGGAEGGGVAAGVDGVVGACEGVDAVVVGVCCRFG
jgi:hypothetical protein